MSLALKEISNPGRLEDEYNVYCLNGRGTGLLTGTVAAVKKHTRQWQLVLRKKKKWQKQRRLISQYTDAPITRLQFITKPCDLYEATGNADEKLLVACTIKSSYGQYYDARLLYNIKPTWLRLSACRRGCLAREPLTQAAKVSSVHNGFLSSRTREDITASNLPMVLDFSLVLLGFLLS